MKNQTERIERKKVLWKKAADIYEGLLGKALVEYPLSEYPLSDEILGQVRKAEINWKRAKTQLNLSRIGSGVWL